MASTHKHLRSSTANKRPTTSIAEGQIALNTNTTSPGLFFKDSTGATIIKVGPVHVGTTAPNATPPAGGSSGNSTGEVWLDTSLTPNGVKIWNGSAWVNATPVGSTTVQGLLELATDAETQAGSDTARAVTPASLQSKMSDSATTTSATTIASSTAVKTAYDLANAALPKSGGTITGNLEIGTTGSLSFEGSTADGFETTIAVTDPTADRTITLPDTTGTVVTTGDTGTVTSAMIANGTIVDADINASAAIAHSKLANITAGQVLLGNASNVPTATALSGDVTVNSSGVTAISSGVIVNADVSASAAIAGTKISPDFGAQNVTTTGTSTAASFIPTSSTVPTNGVYLPAANNVGISTNGSGKLFITNTGLVGIGTSAPSEALTVEGKVWVGNTSAEPASTSDRADITITNDTGPADILFLDRGLAATRIGVDTNDSGNFKFVTDKEFVWRTGGTSYSGLSTGTERFRCDSSGRLLVGTSTARANFYNGTDTGIFQVEGANDITKRFSSFIYGRDNSDGPLLLLGKHRGTSVGGTTVVASGDEIGRITFQGSDGTQFVAGAEIYGYVDGTPGADDMPGRLVFATTADGASSPTERMRISQDGHVSIGVTSIYSSAYRVSVACAGSNGGIIVRAASTDTAFPLSFENSSGTQVGSITNSTTATAFNTSSDYRLKENIVPVSDGISRLQQLKPCRFNFIAEPAKTVDGFLAHEVEGLVPEAITGIKDATDSNGNPIYQAIDQSKLVPLLTAALQEAVARIEQLETAVATLQGS